MRALADVSRRLLSKKSLIYLSLGQGASLRSGFSCFDQIKTLCISIPVEVRVKGKIFEAAVDSGPDLNFRGFRGPV